MSWLKDAIVTDRPATLGRDLALGALIFTGAAGPAVIGGPIGLVMLVAACVLSALLPFSALLAIALSVWTLPLMKMSALVSDIRPDELLLLAALAGAGVRVLVRRDLRMTGVERPYAVFLGLAAVSVGVKLALGFDAPIRSVALPLGRHLLHLLLFMLVMWTVRGRPKRLLAVAVTSAVGGVAASLLGLVQNFSGTVHAWIARTYMTLDAAFSYPYVPGGEGFRSTSAFDGNPNHFGIALAMMALFAAAMAARASERRVRIAWAVSSIAMLTAILYTTSRTSFLAAVGLLVVAAVVYRSRVFAGITVAWLALMALLPNEMPRRLLDLLGTKTASGVVVPDPSVSGRITMMSDGVAGPVAALPMHDNFYLDLFHNFGPLALIGFLWLAYVVGSLLLRAVRENPSSPGYVLGALLAAGALAGASLTGGFFETQRVAEVGWILVALAFAWVQTDSRTTLIRPNTVAFIAHAQEKWSVAGVVALAGAATLDITGRLGQVGPARFTVYQLLALAMIVVAGWWLLSRRVVFTRTPLDVPVIAFVTFAVLSLIPAGERGIALVEVASLASSAAMAALVAILLRNSRQATRVVLGTLAIAGVLGLLAALEYAGIFAVQHPVLVSMGNEIRARVTFEDPNILASFLMTGILLAIPQLLWVPMQRRTRFLGWGAVVLAVVGIAATFSRGALGGLIIGLVCVVLLMRTSKRTRRIFIAVMVVAALVVGAFVLSARWRGEDVVGETHDGSSMDRIYLIEGAVKMWLDHPLGVGAGNFPVQYPLYRNAKAHLGLVESHTAYFTVLAEMGIFGFLAFIWLLWRFFLTTTWPVARRSQDAMIRALATGAGAAGLALCAQAFTYSLEGSKFLWFSIGLGAVAWRLEAEDRSRRAKLADVEGGGGPGPVVCHVTSVNIPTDGRILYHECRSLARRWRTVLVCRDDGPPRTLEGVEILPIPRSGGRLRRWLSIRRLLKVAEGVGADVYHFHNIELMPAMAGFAVRTGLPVIYDAHEHHPDAMATKTYIPRVARRAAAALTEHTERRYVPLFAAVVVADAALEERYSAWSSRVVRLDNFPPLDLFPTTGVERPPVPTLLYVGSISEVRGYDDMLEALGTVRAEIPEARLVLVGTPTDEVAPRLAALNDPAVVVLGPVPYGEIASVMHSATIGLSLLRDIPKFQKNVPTKVFDYMAAQLPYVATSLGPVCELTGGVGGRLVAPGDPTDAARAILELARDPEAVERVAAEGRRLVEERLNWGPLEARLFELYEELAGAPGPRGESTPL